jgi:uroporphyrin-III C-methyltransferase
MPCGALNSIEDAKVCLVGAGPGDPGLLTRRAYDLIQDADVVVYDRLVSAEILSLIQPGTARINVGKQPQCHPIPQHEINELLVSLSRSNRLVVRLKGGDPFLFGRGSEEAMHLQACGVPYAVVPGVTSASGCAAAAGIPLTHRGLSSGVRFVTGHCREDMELDLDWQGLADPDTTLVIYMGVANMAQISIRLMTHGLPASTPVAAISHGTTPRQRSLRSTLGEVASAVSDAGLASPVIFVVGSVVDVADQLLGGTSDEALDAEHNLARMG